ncbi:MAG TPA: RDD family protein [Methylomirabilota bacterium]|nr:RDD family protein [Methylomirabilota bacterium]
MDNHREITIETLTTPPLHIQPAPLTRRFGALLLDSLLISIGWLAIAYLQAPFRDFSFPSALILLLISFLYYFALEWLFSATPGKLMMKLRVVGSNGDPCTFKESALRNLFRIIDWIPVCYVVGIWLVVFSDKKQRAGDRIAHTMVTVAPERNNAPPPAPFLFH